MSEQNSTKQARRDLGFYGSPAVVVAPQLVARIGDRLDWLANLETLSRATPSNQVCPWCFAPTRSLWWLENQLFVCIATDCSLVFSSGNHRISRDKFVAISELLDSGMSYRKTAELCDAAKHTVWRVAVFRKSRKEAYGT